MSDKLPTWLPLGFKVAAHRWYVDPEQPCWLAQFDPDHKPCEKNYRGEETEAFHFFGRGELRDYLSPQLTLATRSLLSNDGNGAQISAFGRDEVLALVALAEWDPRNGGPGCVAHHRRFDGTMTPTLKVPVEALPLHVLRFAVDLDLIELGERRFAGNFEQAIAARLPGIVPIAREQSSRILGGQPSAL